jgi:hypothetical protein
MALVRKPKSKLQHSNSDAGYSWRSLYLEGYELYLEIALEIALDPSKHTTPQNF